MSKRVQRAQYLLGWAIGNKEQPQLPYVLCVKDAGRYQVIGALTLGQARALVRSVEWALRDRAREVEKRRNGRKP